MERLSTQTLLGVRFWDAATNQVVVDGLRVTAQRLSDDRTQRLGRPVSGRVTPAGVVAFAGLRQTETPPTSADDDELLWQTIAASRFVVVEVDDIQQRFLPMAFVVQIPHRGAFVGRGAWQATPLLRPIPAEGDEPGVMLWSTPARSVSSAMALILADIVVGVADRPPSAAYALVHVSDPADDNYHHYGLTDQNGKLNLPLPYPAIPDPPNGAAPGGGRRGGGRRGGGSPVANDRYPALDAQEFPLAITIAYASDQQQPVAGQGVPDMETLLQQSPAQIGAWVTTGPRVLQTTATLSASLRYGRPLILRTRVGAADATVTESFLRIQS